MNTTPLLDVPDTLDGIKAASAVLHQPGRPADALQSGVEHVILDQINNAPRSLQRTIGPSEIGMACDHCLAARLAGWDKADTGIPWAPTVGTGVHMLLEQFFTSNMLKRNSASAPDTLQYWTEHTVNVGAIGDQQIWGSTDLLDVKHGATIDWKLVSKTALNTYRREGPSQQYRVQAHLYAKGWNDAGVPVETVSICFLPRMSNNFYDRHWWVEAYDPDLAQEALDRANNMWNNIQALTQVSVEARDQWITNLPRADNCWDCQKYGDHLPSPTSEHGVLMDITNK